MKKLFALLVCIFTLTTSLTTAASVSAEDLSAYTEGENGEFYYPFAADGDWSSRLTLAGLDIASFVQSDMGNDTGMLSLKPYAGMPAITSGVSGITMQANKMLKIRGSICYKNFDKLVDDKCFISVYLTGLAGVKLYNDPECTDYAEDATGGFVQLNAKVDTNGASMADGSWHNFELSFPTLGAQHSSGKYIDLTGVKVNLWFRPYAGSDFKADEAHFTSDCLTECGYTKDIDSGEWTPGVNAAAPYADCLLDNFEGTFISVPRDSAPLENYYEGADGTFFYPFNAEGDWTNKLNIARQSWVSFKQTDGANDSGMLELKPYAGLSAISSGVSGITMQADQHLKIRGKIRYANSEDLIADKMFLDFYLTGLAGVKLYNDAACTDYAEDAAGGYVRIYTETDIYGEALGDGQWHVFEVSIPTKGAKHSTGKYIDLTEVPVNLWFRPYNGNSFAATTSYFTQEFLDECAAADIEPYADVLLDDFEGYFTSNTRNGGYYRDEQTLYYPFTAETSADTISYVGSNANRSYMADYLGKEGVVTLKNEAGDVITPTWNVTVAEGKKLRVSGDIALMNAADLNAQNINVNALLIINGGSGNSPAGFYEDADCTIPCESVSGNAICHSATMLESVNSDGWVHFSYDFDTTTVYKSTIKRESSDAAKSDVYIKPWEAARISVWFRVASGGPSNDKLGINTTVFTEEYLSSCGYKLENDVWVADPEKSQTTPYMQYALDNLSISSVADGEIMPEDVAVTEALPSKTENISVGDTVEVTYTLTGNHAEGSSRVFVKAGGSIIAAGRSNNGAFHFTVPQYASNKELTVEIIPAVGSVYSFTPYTISLGVISAKDKFTAEQSDNGINWYYDAAMDTENSVIIAALYDINGRLVKMQITNITAGQSYQDSLAEVTAVKGKVFHWTSMENVKPIQKNLTVVITKLEEE